MKESKTLELGLSQETEKIFAPGNLIIGVVRNVRPELFSKGITTPHNAALRDTPNIIRAVMLDTRSMPDRYLESKHNGPRGYAHLSELEREAGVPWKIAVIVSQAEILANFPRQVFAVGREFNNDSWWRHILNRYHYRFPGYSPHGQFVNGIPIVRIKEGTSGQEVRIIPNDPEDAYITPQMWTGVVTNSPELLLNFLEEHSLTLGVPIFYDECLDTPIHLGNLR